MINAVTFSCMSSKQLTTTEQLRKKNRKEMLSPPEKRRKDGFISPLNVCVNAWNFKTHFKVVFLLL